ncbi:hypothetical protein DVA67_027985 [Solirubrobacter sp. CPCC 204708]|uniref:Uncharacterized protein n=1 Tax=Solirubrobacter deserti TaxID=2282478 RepID=A0ABT4RJE0_9ACTN|nr:hypothetical protein [Solirubrobacter deserti]MBE2319837.1 hypothetical protein [Solirubrobacter deserti]MDA0138682.1 hypothetical protein [Solirubrobacter deserti]
MGRILRGAVAGASTVAALALFAPPSAIAHPCANSQRVEASSFLSLHSSSWAGYPTFSNEHECDGEGGAVQNQFENARAAADPVQDAVSTFTYSENMTPIGYSARSVPTSGTGSGAINSDLAFKGNYAIQGTYTGFRVIDISDPANPVQKVNYTGCTTGQGDIVVHGNILVRSWDSPVSAGGAATQSCGGTLVGQGFEGIHIFDISDPENPVMVDVGNDPSDGKQGLRFSDRDNRPNVPGCGSHTATAVPDEARGYLYLYNGGSDSDCTWMDVIKIKLSDPTDAKHVNKAMAGRECHDNTVLLNGANSYATCAGGNGISMFKFDTTIDPTAPGGTENPTLLWSRAMPPINIGHSAAFSYDGKTVVFGWEPGGGTSAQCQASSSVTARTLYFLDPQTGATQGTLLHPRPQLSTENCTWHNFNTVPTQRGNYLVSGNYQSGIYVINYTNPAAPEVIAYADPAPLPKTPTGGDPDGGDWSTYWYNGKIYESDIYRGMMVWDLDNFDTDRAKTVTYSNPQTQIGSYEQDFTGPTASSTNEGAGYKQGSTVPAAFTCADPAGVQSCTASVTNLDTASIGRHSYTVTAVDNAGNQSMTTVNYMVNSTDVAGSAGGTVAATLSLSMGTAPAFAPFVPGVAQEYTASTTPTVTSTAGDATLSVTDPSTTNKGHLVNGSFVLPQPLQGLGTVKTYTGPVSNDKPTITFKQAIGANDALRTGTYSKTLTFTLSTTNP